MVAQSCSPSTFGDQGGWIMRSEDQDHLCQYGETPSYTKINRAWWHTPVVPAICGAEAGGLLELNHTSILQPWQQSETLSQKKERLYEW